MNNKLTKPCLRCGKILVYKRVSSFERASHCWNCRNALGIRYTKNKYAKVCDSCNKSFLVSFHQKTKKYCCFDCYLIARGKPNINRVCLECGEVFRIVTASKKNQKLCSQFCQMKWLHANRKGYYPKGRYTTPCMQCGIEMVFSYACHAKVRKFCSVSCMGLSKATSYKAARDQYALDNPPKLKVVWTAAEDKELRRLYKSGQHTSTDMASILCKTKNQITVRISHLGLRRSKSATKKFYSLGGKRNKGRKRPDLAERNKTDRRFGESNPFYGKKHTVKTRKIISDSQKTKSVFIKLNSDPEFIKKKLKGLCKRPNKPETAVAEILKNMFPGEYKYT